MTSATQAPLPHSFPILPPVAGDAGWPSDLIQAHERLNNLFESARGALNLDESDAIRLTYHLDKAETVARPIVVALQSNDRSNLPSDYIASVAALISSLEHHLQTALANSQAM
jgi:hypothetical protein